MVTRTRYGGFGENGMTNFLRENFVEEMMSITLKKIEDFINLADGDEVEGKHTAMQVEKSQEDARDFQPLTIR